MSVGIFSSLSNPLLPLLLNELEAWYSDNFFVVLDRKNLNSKEEEIWLCRTGGDLGLGLKFDELSRFTPPFFFVDSHNGSDCINLLKRLAPKLMVNAGTPRKLIQEVLDIPALGVLNVHPGILPKYRGSSCVEWAIINGDPIGNSAHFMTIEYDQGVILDVEKINVSEFDDYKSIRVKTYKSWSKLMSKSIFKILDNKIPFHLDSYPTSNFVYPPITAVQMLQVIDRISSGRYLEELALNTL